MKFDKKVIFRINVRGWRKQNKTNTDPTYFFSHKRNQERIS